MLFLIKHLWRATRYSWHGLKIACQIQLVFAFELLCLAVAVPFSIYFGKTVVEKVLLISSIGLIIIVELINSAIETTIDRISSAQHPLSGRAKDLASAAVFVTVINAILIWAIIIGAKIIA